MILLTIDSLHDFDKFFDKIIKIKKLELILIPLYYNIVIFIET